MPHDLVSSRLRNNAKAMRKEMTDAELKLLNAVRAHRLMGLGFRRQVPIGKYIVDFACAEFRIVVEVDGAQHNDPHALRYDQERSAFLENSGWTVLRFTNAQVLSEPEALASAVRAHARLNTP